MNQPRTIQIERTPAERRDILASMDSRSRQLIERFIRESYADQLLLNGTVQADLIDWLDAGHYSNATMATKRQDLKRIEKAVEGQPDLAWLADSLEELRADKRNAVPRAGIKTALSRLIRQDLLKKMQQVVSEGDGVSQTAYEGYLVFLATLMTGLRPSEWATAKVERSVFLPEEGQPLPVLKVRTSKTKDHQEERFRHLVLNGFSEGQLDLIELIPAQPRVL